MHEFVVVVEAGDLLPSLWGGVDDGRRCQAERAPRNESTFGNWSRKWLGEARIECVTDLVLTAERRDELAALLGDEQRLRAEYPKVADYLDAAPMLAGTGDDQADAAFDLRFVHYMARDKPTTGNPYWDIVSPSVFDRNGRRVVNGGRSTGSARLGYAA
ncbi:hypothetical protein [Nocardia transvalensis]|uniref:hypothetical protein n=1 Tax=Nocardia transvalensis TaxID=37333 RepID=UPI0018935EFE|nr:hypothetical protein [Nocardia transvalensis]MBF6331865.1 hypothetical protein [Nocardia transvalensis]